jgi:hypothetical protein
MGVVTPEYIQELHSEKESWRKRCYAAETHLSRIAKIIDSYGAGNDESATDTLNRINRELKGD